MCSDLCVCAVCDKMTVGSLDQCENAYFPIHTYVGKSGKYCKITCCMHACMHASIVHIYSHIHIVHT